VCGLGGDRRGAKKRGWAALPAHSVFVIIMADMLAELVSMSVRAERSKRSLVVQCAVEGKTELLVMLVQEHKQQQLDEGEVFRSANPDHKNRTALMLATEGSHTGCVIQSRSK
jgi:type II secretory pathway component PulC